jgi:hypothetical protein
VGCSGLQWAEMDWSGWNDLERLEWTGAGVDSNAME